MTARAIWGASGYIDCVLIAIVYIRGHGGSGVTLSWGCTAEVANLVAM